MPVQDIERAKGFYRDTLGLRITNEDGEWAEVDANGLTLGLNGHEPSRAQGEGGPAGISDHPWGREATFKDSEGNDIQLYEAPKN